jgi:hypothetical protein
VLGGVLYTERRTHASLCTGDRRAADPRAQRQPATVHAIDLASRSTIGKLALPGPTDRLWCVSRASLEAFIAEHDARGFTELRRVGLEPLRDARGSVVLDLEPGASFDRVAFALSGRCS